MNVRAGLRRVLRRGNVGGNGSAPTIASCLDDDERRLVERCQPYTLASPERIIATADAVRHVVESRIDGALVECGVWRGGSVLAMVLSLQRLGVDDRPIYLYDTFAGMTAPTVEDVSPFDPPARTTFERAQATGKRAWSYLFGEEVFGLEQVRDLLHGTGYPAELFHFVVGPVEETIPTQLPEQIAVLRLDTDWYESTRHEMAHLYPRLARGGVLIVDDYGHWSGARQAVEEHFASVGERPLLARTDYTGRMAVKL